MKEFIEKLIGRLEEKSVEITFPLYPDDSTSFVPITEAISIVNQLAEEYNNGWIPFTQRELTEEEKEHYGEDIKYMLDCKLPEEDEEILVTYKFKDKFYVDHDIFLKDGSMCYLDSSRELIDEVIAWQPLPAPYQPKGE